MDDPLRQWPAVLTFGVTLVLSTWILFRGARSSPTRLLAALLVSFAVIQGFEFLWLRHGDRTYIHLQFVGVILAPCVAFHYATSLLPPSAWRRVALTAVYGTGVYFLAVDLGGLSSRNLYAYFWAPEYNLTFVAVFGPVMAIALGMLAWLRFRNPDPGVRCLYSYPLVAGLIIVPLGFLELAAEPLGWTHAPRLASLGCLLGSVVIAVGVLRHRTVYDAFALLRRDAAGVLRAMVQGILFVEPNGRVLFSNRIAKELLGLEREPATLAEAGLDMPSTPVSVVRKGERILEMRVAESSDVFPPGRRSLILQDRTHDYHLLQDLASSKALASLGQAAATLAHEVRNPLTGIRSALDCVVHDLEHDRAPEARHIELMQEEARRVDRLLERCLQLSRPVELQREPCDVNALLLRAVGQEAVRKNGGIRTDLSPGLPSVSADPELLGQLFSNLLRNALDASGQAVVATAAGPDTIRVSVFNPDARIPESIAQRLFDPFVTGKTHGTGLGLALCRKIAAAHGATLEGRNVDGGVRFDFTLKT